MNRAASSVVIVAYATALVGFLCGAARAGDASKPNPEEISPEQARCQAMGDGFFAVKGSSQCLRISGYISAGVGFSQPSVLVVPKSGPFAGHTTAFSDKDAGVSVESSFNTDAGPARIVVGVGGRNLTLDH